MPRGAKLLAEKIAAVLILVLLVAGFVAAERLQRWGEVAVYQAPIVYAESSPYQRIVITRNGDDLRLWLNGNLQFSSRDEYRYHEALVQPALAPGGATRANVLMFGGGDGLAAREILKHRDVQHDHPGRSRPGDDRPVRAQRHAARRSIAARSPTRA